MKLEANKFYRTRSGLKVKVVCTDYPSKNPIIGYYTSLGGFSYIQTWNESGHIVQDHGGDYDIISEWVDEPKTKKVTLRRALYSSNGGFWLSEFTSFDREETPSFLRWHDSIEVEVPVKE